VRRVRDQLIAPAICIAVAACSGGAHEATTSSVSVPPIPESALEGLLLNPAQLDVVLGATQMTIIGAYDHMNDNSGPISDKNCVAIWGPGEPTVYAGSGAGALRAEALKDQPGNSDVTHAAFQAVVAFPSADKAAAFFTDSSKRWPACSNLRYTVTDSASSTAWDVGPVSTTDGTLSVTQIQEQTPGWTCQRALTVSNNIAIDVNACGFSQTPGGTGIARQIASRVGNHLVGPGS
jgi:hypothetical protein